MRSVKTITIFTLLAICVSMSFGQTSANRQRNSTEKFRPTPSQTAAKVGSAVNWQRSFDEARKISEETGKPIFWYVPTVEGSFMDRKVEVDRYMLAGMFSWPKIIDRLNKNFVPLMSIPDTKQAGKFELIPYKFVEPGFLVIDSQGTQKLRCDRLTTQHPQWLKRLLATVSEVRPEQVEKTEESAFAMDPSWRLFREGAYRKCLDGIHILSTTRFPSPASSVEGLLLRGMCQYRLGNRTEAVKSWQLATSRFGEHPLVWKAAAEAEGIGPFVRGFEVHRNLPDKVYDNINLLSVTSTTLPETYSESELWQRGIQFLLGMQRSDGGFVDSDYDFGGADSLPNVHVAITAICGMALLESKERKLNDEKRQRHNAVELARNYVLSESNWNSDDTDELFWAHAYRVRLLTRSIRHGWNGNRELQRAVEGLESMQSRSGSWYHEYPNPLVTALALIALKEAETTGATIDRQVVRKAVRSLKMNRGRGGFYYSDVTPMSSQFQLQDLTDASAGRLPLCELALFQWGASNESALAQAVRVSTEKQSHLLAAMKYDDHTSRHAYGGFFMWFDLQGRSEAIRSLSNNKQKNVAKRKLKDLVMSLPEIDGCFVDSHEIGRCYGTAMALLTLAATE